MVYYTQMMNELEKTKEEMAFALFGRSSTIAILNGQCVKCGGFVTLRSVTSAPARNTASLAYARLAKTASSVSRRANR